MKKIFNWHVFSYQQTGQRRYLSHSFVMPREGDEPTFGWFFKHEVPTITKAFALMCGLAVRLRSLRVGIEACPQKQPDFQAAAPGMKVCRCPISQKQAHSL